MIGYVWHQDAKEQVIEILVPYSELHDYIHVDTSVVNEKGRWARQHVDQYLAAVKRSDHRNADMAFHMMVSYLYDPKEDPPARLAYATALRIHLHTATQS